MAEKLQAILFQAMSDPAFYPHAVQGLSQQETHISKVFLTGPYAYKIKKPVDLGFANFTSLEQRRYFCEQEVLLNKRLTDGIYLGVIPIGYDGSQFRLNAPGQIVEYAVKMRQLPAAATMRSRMSNGRISRDDLYRLAGRLAGFHETARRVTDPAVRAYTQSACTENFRQIMPFSGKMLDAGQYNFVRAATFNFFIRNRKLLEKRIASGRFRDGHGDLRAEHVYFTADGRIQILDCIEFNERLRLVDTASDLAFLIMDLDSRLKSESALELLQDYYEHSADLGMPALLDFYKCYRAMVRCKVNCIRLGAHDLSSRLRSLLTANAQCYLHLAHYYARRFSRPIIWIFCGLPGSGKSTLAAKLADLLTVESCNSDRIRKQMAGLSPLARGNGPADSGIYTPEMSAKVYDLLYSTAQRAIAESRSLILDATYSAASQRKRLRHLADDCGIRILFAECRTGDHGLRRRLAQREISPSVSDARTAHLELLKARFESLAEIPPAQHVVLDTGRSQEVCLRELLTAAYLDKADKWPGMPSDRKPSVRRVQEPVA
jgi:aminoglycoside phosphotransferase family enzyme/predicted kinase